MDFEKCYVFRPEDERPAKRRRTEPQGLHASWTLRRKAYQEAWQALQERINKTKLEQINATTVSKVTSYLTEVANKPMTSRIPAGLILTGPNAALHSSLTRQASVVHGETSIRRIFVPLPSSSSSNLKGLLKSIIQKATSRMYEDEDDEDLPIPSRKGTKLLNYDLRILHEYVQEHRIQQVIIAFEDTEAFDSDLLSEVIELLQSWLDRIPFVCLFSIATSVDFLQQRLSTSAVKSLAGRLFDAALSSEELEQAFDAVIAPDNALWIGPSLMAMVLERQSDFLQSIDEFVHAVKYAYMSSYYANALTLFLHPGLASSDVPRDHFEALRNTGSFQALVQQLVDDGDAEHAQELLDSDEALFEQVTESIANGRDALAGLIVAIDLIRHIQAHLPNTPISSRSSLYIQAMSGKLQGSPLLRTLLLTIRKAPSDVTLALLQSLSTHQPLPEALAKTTAAATTELSALLDAQTTASHPLRSADDAVAHATLRTTVVAQKVSLSKQRAALSSQDTAYTTLLRGVAGALESFLADTLSAAAAQTLPFHEIFIYDLRSPHRESRNPRPRHAVERALAAPHDYLDCACCAPESAAAAGKGEGDGEGEEVTLAASQPATAVLYQLYLESGSLINASDLWQAFRAVVAPEAEAEEDVARVMALFQRALAELRYLGFVKATRKRVDHVAKVAWRGL